MADRKIAVKVKAAAEKARDAAERMRHEPIRLPKRVEDFLDGPLPAMLGNKPWVDRHWAFSPWALRHWALEDGTWLAPIDVFQEKGAMVVKADLPGLKMEDIDVSVQGNMLLLKGHREQVKERKNGDYYLTERSAGTFQRSIAIPEGIDPEGMTATYKDGVLEVRIPTAAEAQLPHTKVKVTSK